METIFKYSLDNKYTTLKTHKGARVLCVGAQRNKPYIWLQVNTKNEKETRGLYLAYTGEALPFNSSFSYIDTVMLNEGELVLHIFEIGVKNNDF